MLLHAHHVLQENTVQTLEEEKSTVQRILIQLQMPSRALFVTKVTRVHQLLHLLKLHVQQELTQHKVQEPVQLVQTVLLVLQIPQLLLRLAIWVNTAQQMDKVAYLAKQALHVLQAILLQDTHAQQALIQEHLHLHALT